jgi:hypothetical protein
VRGELAIPALNEIMAAWPLEGTFRYLHMLDNNPKAVEQVFREALRLKEEL